jgi:hypothetical protein
MKDRKPWPLILIALPAAVAVWSGWVGLGQLAGFGLVTPLPGIVPWHLDTAITLPVGVEAYGAYALGVWLGSGDAPEQARRFARRSAIGSLLLGIAGQVAFHLLAASHAVRAPWPVVVLVSCVPVVVLGFAAALTHLRRAGEVAAPRETATVPDSYVASWTPAASGDETPAPAAGETPHETARQPVSKAPARQPPRHPRRDPAAAKRDNARRLIEADPGISASGLASLVGVSRATAGRWKAEMREQPAEPEGEQVPHLTRVQ